MSNLPSSLAAEIAAGDMLTLRDVARRFGIDPSVAFRWMQRGLPTGKGDRVRLDALRIGSWRTSEAAVRRFLAALPQSSWTPPQPQLRTPTQRERDSARAAAELRAKYGM